MLPSLNWQELVLMAQFSPPQTHVRLHRQLMNPSIDEHSEPRLGTGKERNKIITQVVFIWISPLRGTVWFGVFWSVLDSLVLTLLRCEFNAAPPTGFWCRTYGSVVTVWNPNGGQLMEIGGHEKQNLRLFLLFLHNNAKSERYLGKNNFPRQTPSTVYERRARRKTCWPWASCLVAMTTQLVPIVFAASLLPECRVAPQLPFDNRCSPLNLSFRRKSRKKGAAAGFRPNY